MKAWVNNIYPMVPLGVLLIKSKEQVEIDPYQRYKQVTIKLWGKGVVLRDEVDGAEIAGSKRFIVRPQQFILSRIDARNGAFGLVPGLLDGAVVSNDFPTFTPDPSRVLPTFLGWMSKTRDFVNLCRAASEGTTNRVRLKEDRFMRATVPLPPLPEQRRIVARIEELAARIEEARGLRRQAVEEAEAFGTAAFSTAYDEATEIAGGVEKLDDLCLRITDGTHVTPTYVPEGVPFLSVKDVTTGTIRFDETRFITPEEHAILTRRCKPERNDVLLTKVGTTGFAKAVDVDREFSIFVSLALLKLDQARLDPQFTEYMLNSTKLRDHSASGTRGVGNKNLVLKFIREFPMPAPSLSEQHHIVTYLDGLQAKVKSLKQLQVETAAELDALLPSVLDRAFKGEL